MKTLILIAVLFLAYSFYPKNKKVVAESLRSFYEHEVQTIDGQAFDLKTLKGKKLMVVNVASECGLTPQYKELEALYQTYGGAAFEILAFPANDFGAQEPGTHSEIASFCEKNYGVTFLVFEKITVKGAEQHPLYEWLTQKKLNGAKTVSVKWNFQKFLIDEEGRWVDYLLPTTSPQSEKVIRWIEN